MRHLRPVLLAVLASTALAAGCTGAAEPSGESEPTATLAGSSATPAADPVVLIVSLDGLNPTALRELGREGTPTLHRMIRQGASTLNARTEVEQTETLPNHTGMVTSRRITAREGGHGVTWNDERLDPLTVQEAAGHGVDSLFAIAYRQGLDSAVYSAKEKFTLFERSWPQGVVRIVVDKDNDLVARKARRDLGAAAYDVQFVHLSLPDRAGHEHGWLGPEYLAAVERSDALVGTLLDVVRGSEDLRERVTVVLTADHGGPRGQRTHIDPELRANYTVPFIMWGAGVARGADLYELSPDLTDPGRAQVPYGAYRQPVRNGYVANVATEVLGLPTVRGSGLDVGSELNWR